MSDTDIEPHDIPGLYRAPGTAATHGDDALFTLWPGFGGREECPQRHKADVAVDGKHYRHFNPKRSKLAAAVLRGLGPDLWPFRDGEGVLYLGAANGTTASHLSDALPNSAIYCVEFAKRSFRDLVEVCRTRPNMVPLLNDATRPGDYRMVVGRVGVVYQDVSQRDQVGIFLANAGEFLEDGDAGVLMYKARSTDVTARPEDLFRRAEAELARAGYRVEFSVRLEPYEKDHAVMLLKKDDG